jgi:hypothetical protein
LWLLGTAVYAGLVAVLPFITVALSVLVVATVSAKHAILAKATSSMANRMLLGVMVLDVMCVGVGVGMGGWWRCCCSKIIIVYTK